MSMIALRVPPDVARALAVQKFTGTQVPPDEYHVTLVYFEELSGASWEVVDRVLRDVTSDTTPFTMLMNSLTTFPPGEDGYPVICPVTAPAVHALRERITKALDSCGVPYSKKHPTFQPHVTLAYVDANVPAAALGPLTWEAREIVLYDDTPKVFYPLTPSNFDETASGERAWKNLAAKIMSPRTWKRYLALTKTACDGCGQVPAPNMATEEWECGCGGGCKKASLAERVARKYLAADRDVATLLAIFRDHANKFLADGDKIEAALKTLEATFARRTVIPEEVDEWAAATSLVLYRKTRLLMACFEPGDNLFTSILETYALAPATRKKVELAARTWSKSRVVYPKNTSGLDDKLKVLKWYSEKATLVGAHMELATKCVAEGKTHAEGTDPGGATKLKVGSFTLVNTGGFDAKVMTHIKGLFEKAEQLLRGSGFGEVCYGDVAITNTLTKSNVSAFYKQSDDSLYVRANAKPGWDTLKTILHELGHRYDFRFFKKPGMLDRLYRKMEGQEIERVRKMPPPKPGDTLQDSKATYEIVRVEPRKLMIKKVGDPKNQVYTATLDTWYQMGGAPRKEQMQADPNFVGFVSQYAEKGGAHENFAEMFAYYCMGDLSVPQSLLFENMVFNGGVGFTASNRKAAIDSARVWAKQAEDLTYEVGPDPLDAALAADMKAFARWDNMKAKWTREKILPLLTDSTIPGEWRDAIHQAFVAGNGDKDKALRVWDSDPGKNIACGKNVAAVAWEATEAKIAKMVKEWKKYTEGDAGGGRWWAVFEAVEHTVDYGRDEFLKDLQGRNIVEADRETWRKACWAMDAVLRRERLEFEELVNRTRAGNYEAMVKAVKALNQGAKVWVDAFEVITQNYCGVPRRLRALSDEYKAMENADLKARTKLVDKTQFDKLLAGVKSRMLDDADNLRAINPDRAADAKAGAEALERLRNDFGKVVMAWVYGKGPNPWSFMYDFGQKFTDTLHRGGYKR